MRRVVLASLFLSSSHAFVLVPSAHAHPLAAPPSAHVHPLAALPLTRAHPLVARGGALSRGNEVMMILNPFSLFSIVLDALDPYPNDLDEMERVCPSHPAMARELSAAFVRPTSTHTRIPLPRNLTIHAATSPLRLSVAVLPPRSCPAEKGGGSREK